MSGTTWNTAGTILNLARSIDAKVDDLIDDLVDTDVAAVKAVVDDILTDTGTTIPGTIASLDTLIDGAITKIDTIDGIVDTVSTAVVTTIPGTITSLDTLIDGAITKIDTIDGIVDTVSTAVVTTIPGTITSLDTLIDGAITKIDTIDGIVDTISTAVVTTIPGTITSLDTLIDGAITKIDTIDGVADSILTAVNAGFALTGDAVVGDVLTTKTFYKDDFKTKLTGTMANNAGDVASVSAHMDAGTVLHVVPATGYTDGVNDASTVDLAVVDADLAVGNIKTGVAVLGVTGTYDTTVTPITAATVQTGLEGWVNGAKVTGSGTQTLSAANDTVAAGYYEATTLSAVDTDLAVANIKTGTVIFGKTGTYDTEAGAPIAAGTVLIDQVGFVNGSKITGTMVNHAVDITATSISRDGDTLKFLVPAGYYPGSINVTYQDTDFVEGNILSGVTIFGLLGTHA